MFDFMAYLDNVVTGFDSHVFKLNKERVTDKNEPVADKNTFRLQEKSTLQHILQYCH